MFTTTGKVFWLLEMFQLSDSPLCILLVSFSLLYQMLHWWLHSPMYLHNLCCKQWKLKEEEGGSSHCLNLVIQFRKLRNVFWKSPCNTVGNTYQEMQMWEMDHDRSLYSKTHDKFSADLRKFTLGGETFTSFTRANLGENVCSVLWRADQKGKIKNCLLIHPNNLLWYCTETGGG